MGKKRRGLARVLAATAAVVFVATCIPAGALSRSPDLTWGVEGKVYALARHGDTLFVGGTITKALGPSGQRPAISDLAAFSISTGRYLPTFVPTVTRSDGPVKIAALAVSSDGKRLYIGGSFDEVDGQPRIDFAAVDVATGARVAAKVDPAPSGTVLTILAAPDLVYFGGSFTQVGSQPRMHLAAISASTGALSSTWAPSTSAGIDPCPGQLPLGTDCGPATDGGTGNVHSLALSPSGSSLYIGGNFYYVNGTPRNALAKVSAADGSLLGWRVPWMTIPSEAPGQRYTGPNDVRTIVTTRKRIFIGFGRSANGFEGYSAKVASTAGECGSGCARSLWTQRAPGNPESMALSPDRSRLFVGGHFGTAVLDYPIPACGDAAWAHGLVSVDPKTGAFFCGWLPAVRPFGGTIAPGSGVDPPNFQGVTSMELTPSGLFVGGKFTSISNVTQNGIARFTL